MPRGLFFGLRPLREPSGGPPAAKNFEKFLDFKLFGGLFAVHGEAGLLKKRSCPLSDFGHWSQGRDLLFSGFPEFRDEPKRLPVDAKVTARVVWSMDFFLFTPESWTDPVRISAATKLELFFRELGSDIETLFRTRPEQAWMVAIFVVVVWVALVWLLLRYVPGFKYPVLLFFKNIFGGGHRRKILEVLGDADIPMTLLVEEEDGRKRFLCHTRFQYKKGEKLYLEVTGHRGLEAATSGREILCHFRPIRHMHLRINGFKSRIVSHTRTSGGSHILTIRMPLSTGSYDCRFAKRYPVRDQRTVILGVWLADPTGPGGATFMASPPAILINDARSPRVKGGYKVFDISRYGVRFGILQELLLHDVRGKLVPDRPACLELRLFDPRAKQFERHYLAGTLRHKERGYRGMLILGIEFTHAAEKKTTGGLPEFTWIRTEKSRPFQAYASALKALLG